jgi:hypothetical protein
MGHKVSDEAMMVVYYRAMESEPVHLKAKGECYQVKEKEK